MGLEIENKAEKFIDEFRSLIVKFNLVLINTYKLNFQPTYKEAGRKFPKKGVLISDGHKFEYRFHGGGCTLNFDSTIIHYNIDVQNNNEIRITEWDLYEFINTYYNGNVAITIVDLPNIFLELAKKNILIQRDRRLLVFNINDSYFISKNHTNSS